MQASKQQAQQQHLAALYSLCQIISNDLAFDIK